MYHWKQTAWDNHLRSFGEMAVAKATAEMQPKFHNNGFLAIFLG
jgi:hypothetical protein